MARRVRSISESKATAGLLEIYYGNYKSQRMDVSKSHMRRKRKPVGQEIRDKAGRTRTARLSYRILKWHAPAL